MSFSPTIQRIFLYALQEASRLSHAEVEESHFLLALMRADNSLRNLLESFGLPVIKLRALIASKLIVNQDRDLPTYSHRLRRTIEQACHEAQPLEPKHILQVIIQNRQGLAFEILNATGELARLELLLEA